MSARIALFVIHNNAPGIVRMRLNLAHGFLARGHAVDLVETRPGTYALFPIPEGARVVNLGENADREPARALARYLESDAPDGLLSAGHPANLASIRAREFAPGRTRLVVGIHMTLSSFLKGSPPQLARTAREIRAAYGKADARVAVSQGVADDLVQLSGLPPAAFQVIGNPAVPPDLDRRAAAPVDHPFFAAGQPPVVLGCGRLAPQKDFVTLLNAFALLRRSGPMRLIVLGEGPERERLEGLARELGIADDVAFPGFMDNPFPWMRRAALFVLSSVHEGLGNVLIEAMACGTPVASMDCPSGPREILLDGQLGPLSPVRNAEALAAAMRRALDAPASPDALKRRAQDFSQDHACERYLALLLSQNGNTRPAVR
jgi:glycosyltransferase involved in cell wall biosynthesis